MKHTKTSCEDEKETKMSINNQVDPQLRTINNQPLRTVISAGGRFVSFHQAHQLIKRKSLVKFFTCSYTKRDHQYIPATFVHNSNLCQLLDTCFDKLRFNYFIKRSSFYVLKDNIFDYGVSKEIEKLGQIDLFMGWAHSLLNSIPAIRKSGAKIILETGTSHILTQQKILQEEYKKYTISHAPITQKNREKILAEYEQTDYIMTPSEFVRKSFITQGIEPKKILKINYGSEVAYFKKEYNSPWEKPPIFTIIFVGMLSIRKGIHYLLDAWNKLNLPENKTQLLLVGSMQQDIRSLLRKTAIKNNIVFYGPTSQEKLRKLYHTSSLFVLPSVEDGFATVIREAMASSLPVICTTQSGGDDLISNGQEGFVVPACNSQELGEKIEWCYNNQEQAHLMGIKGQETIKEHTWDAYGDHVYALYQKILGL